MRGLLKKARGLPSHAEPRGGHGRPESGCRAGAEMARGGRGQSRGEAGAAVIAGGGGGEPRLSAGGPRRGRAGPSPALRPSAARGRRARLGSQLLLVAAGIGLSTRCQPGERGSRRRHPPSWGERSCPVRGLTGKACHHTLWAFAPVWGLYSTRFLQSCSPHGESPKIPPGTTSRRDRERHLFHPPSFRNILYFENLWTLLPALQCS